jgi:integration host factor subunit alpha
MEEFSNGSEIMISGIGKWTVRKKNARKGRNPQTGESVTIAARKVVTFKPSPNLRDELNC